MGDLSIDIDAIASHRADDTDSTESRPIMILLRNLIRNKQNTVMTNAQIIDILQKEFDINIDTHHELQVDIFIKIIKKYLKDWPQWEELERVSAKLNNLKDYEAVQKVLNHKYKNLKEYLGVMLNIAKDAVGSAEYEDVFNEQKEIENDDTNDVVMEVHCSRDQLNHLIYRQPKTEHSSQYKTTIFNVSSIEPKRIQYSMLSLESILKLWCFKISVCLPWFMYYRELTYNYEHVLVNKARKSPEESNTFNTSMQMKSYCVRNKNMYSKLQLENDIQNIINIMSKHYSQSSKFIGVLFKIIMEDIWQGPDTFDVPSMFRKYCNKYKYVRYLYVENLDSVDDKFDLQLEETMSPLLQFNIAKVAKSTGQLPAVEEWLKIECLVCKVKFAGSFDVQETVVNHYRDNHGNNEPEWQCSHCKRTFGMMFLAENNWHHDC